MAGIVFFAFFLAGGLLIARFWLPGLRPLTRWYIGGSIGLLLTLWLPVLWANAVAFSVEAHLLAALTLGLLVMAAWLTRDKRPRVRFMPEDRRMLRAVLLVALPLTLLAGWLEYTHSIRIAADGTYHVGQSTYGDLQLHLAITTSAINAKFPLNNSLMVGATMAYPFLADTFASSFYLLGMGLSASMALTGTQLCASIFTGYALLCANLVRRRSAMWLAVCLLFLNGGLGFIYILSGTIENGSVSATVWDNLYTVFTGYYQTPTNQPNPNNLRWVNIICDMFVPQRGIMGGWTMLMPVFLLLVPPLMRRERMATRALITAGVMAGGMPLLHTHSFLALGISSIGFCLYATATAPKRRRWEAFKPFLLYGGIAAALSLPQLFAFTFVQATHSDHFLRFQFNWCNNRGGNGLVDPYLWFYIKNIGLPYVLILIALSQRRKGDLRTQAEQANARTDGLYRKAAEQRQPETDKQPGAAFAAQAALEVAPPKAEQITETVPEAAAAQEDADSEPDEPAYSGLLAGDMPAYGQTGRIAPVPSRAEPKEDRPYLRPLPPEKLRPAAFAPEDEDRVGIMQAVTGTDKPEESRRPFIVEIFHPTYHPTGEEQAVTVPGEAETCFADEPPARDWVRRNRLLAAGAFLIYLVAEFVIFQPNEYDNNKLFYVWFLLCLPMAADYAAEMFTRLKGLGGRSLLAVWFLILCFLSAGLTVGREAISDYQAYTVSDIAVAGYVRENTPEHSIFLTGNQHLNPVASLAGRTIICGSDLYLYYHGFNTTSRKLEVSTFYADPENNLALLSEYGVEYIYVSPSERYSYAVDEDALRRLFTPVYESEDGNYLIFAVPEMYRETGGTAQDAYDPSQDPASEG